MCGLVSLINGGEYNTIYDSPQTQTAELQKCGISVF